MGERAFEQAATDDDLRQMSRELEAGLRAGAFGLSTSRSPSHSTADGRPVAGRLATWDEVRRLVDDLVRSHGFRIGVELYAAVIREIDRA